MCIKKFLVSVVMFTTIFSTCNAAQVRLSDLGAESFLNKMTSMLQTDSMKKICPIAITGLIRDEKSDMRDYNLTAWSALFAKDMSSPPEGFVVFLTDTEGCVNSTKFVFKVTSDWAEKMQALLMSTLWTLDFTPQEAAQFIKGGKNEQGVYSSDISISRQNKTYVLIVTQNNDMVIVLLLATDGRR